MQLKSLARWTCAMLAAAAVPAMAQQIPASDFAKYAELDEVALSPTGDYLAMAVPTPDGKETNLKIVKLADGSEVKTLRFGQESHVMDVTWTNDETITVARARRFPGEEFKRPMGQLMSTNLTGDAQRTLFAYTHDDGGRRGRNKDEGWASLWGALDKEPGKALVGFYCWDCGDHADTVVYKVDTATGARQEVERIKDGEQSSGLVFDHDGIGRVAYSEDNDGTPTASYRPTASSAWVPLPKSIAGYEIVGGVIAEDNNTLYARISDKGEATQLYKVDLAAGTRTKLLASTDDVEVDTILTAGRNNVPFGVTYTAHKPSVQYFDNTSPWAQLHAALMKKFPGQMVYFLEFTRDDKKALFWTSSDRVPGNYYVLDRGNGNKIVQVGARKPWFDGKPMAAMKPIEFKSRDGKTTLYGFVTTPAGPGPHPMVVMPHGGPFNVNDEWGFEPDAQFLASRGYAVLQVNYRGSGGRGDNFVTEAYQQWGGMIQEDIADGVKFAIEKKLADPARVCMYGASFGGYSALIQPVLNPGMYKCAVGYVGVYDLPMLSKNKDDADTTERFYGRTLGTDMEALARLSPVNRVKEIKVPVFLVHGKSDGNVRFGQYRAMEAALRDIGQPAETFLAPGEGHGFSNPDNIAELYRRLEKFLDKNIGPGSQTAATQ